MSLTDTLIYAFAHVCLLSCIAHIATSQRQGPAALRQTIQWHHNGKLFSILSQGSEYQAPVKRDGEQTQVRPIAIVRSDDGDDASVRSSARTAQSRGSERPQSGALSRGRESHTDRLRLPSKDTQTPPPSVNDSRPNDDVMVGDDPYNPYKSTDPDNPYYNYYDTYERPPPRQRPGYGTGYFQNGKNIYPCRTMETQSCHWIQWELYWLVIWEPTNTIKSYNVKDFLK